MALLTPPIRAFSLVLAFFMGFASIRLIPANFLTRKLTSPVAETLVRKRDIATQIIGFLLLITGLALSMLFNV